MPIIIRKFWFLFFLLLGFGGIAKPVQAEDVRFTASVDRTTLSVNETFTLTLEIQGVGLSSADPKLPDLNHFGLISGPNTSTSFQFINGRASSSKTLSFVLRPQMVGPLSIGPVELTMGGKLYRTEPIAITVTPSSSGSPGGSAQPTQPGSPAPSPAPSNIRVKGSPSDLFVQVNADKTQAYQGEQVILTYTLYTRLSVSTYEISKLPGTAGFWMEEFPAQAAGPEVRDAVIGGQRYKAALIRRIALFPTRSGDLTVDPLEVTCQVQVMDRSRRSNDPFDMLFNNPFGRYRTEERFVETEPLHLKVLPLPEAGKPVNFSGAVGDFKLDVSLDRAEAKTNEALTLRMLFSGSGNVKMLPPPNFNAPSDFESYDPKESVQVNKSGNRISGTKTYEYVLIPRFAGRQKIPPVSFSFFNPFTKSYQTLTKGGFEIQVEQGSSLPATSVPGVSKEDVKLLGQDIHYLKTPKRLMPLAKSDGLPGIYIFGMILPPLMVMLYFAGIRITGATAFQTRLKSRQAFTHALRELKKLEKISASSGEDKLATFYGHLHRTLLTYLGEKMNLPAKGLKEDEVLDLMSRRNAESAAVEEVREIFHTCNWARFATGSGAFLQMDMVLKKTRGLVHRLEGLGEKTT